MRAVILAQVTAFAAFSAEVEWLSAWWAMFIVVFGAAQIAGLQALFRWHKAHKPVVWAVCPACARAEQYRADELQVPRG
jgi:hypothetical protein